MARKSRFAPPDHWLHITQRGNYRQQTFFADRDYSHFLSLLERHTERRKVDVLAYCLMPNHFHLIARAHEPYGISKFIQSVNAQYAQYLHGRLTRTGRLWQGRFYSCVLDTMHLISALRYVELNPVHARMVPNATDFRWSSAAAHTGKLPKPLMPNWLDQPSFRELFTKSEWAALLAEPQPNHERAAIRRATQAELPLGSPAFIAQLEQQFDRRLHALPPGPKKPIAKPIPPQSASWTSLPQRVRHSSV